jgi:uncharacterized damage-inducible protein DinB
MPNTQTLAPIRYHFATTRALMDLAEKLETADYLAKNGYSADGIHGTLFHLTVVANAWRTGLTTGKQGVTFDRERVQTLADVRAQQAIEEAAWLAYLETQSDADIAAERHLTNWRGEPVSFYTWQILQHFVLHGMQHHSELARMLTDKGHSPGNIDFLYFKL